MSAGLFCVRMSWDCAAAVCPAGPCQGQRRAEGDGGSMGIFVRGNQERVARVFGWASEALRREYVFLTLIYITGCSSCYAIPLFTRANSSTYLWRRCEVVF